MTKRRNAQTLTELCKFTEAELARAERYLARSKVWHREHPTGLYAWSYDEQFEQLELAI